MGHAAATAAIGANAATAVATAATAETAATAAIAANAATAVATAATAATAKTGGPADDRENNRKDMITAYLGTEITDAVSLCRVLKGPHCCMPGINP